MDRETREHLGRAADSLDRGQITGRLGWGILGHCAQGAIDAERPMGSNTDASAAMDAFCQQRWGRDMVSANDAGLLKPHHFREAAGLTEPGQGVTPQTPEDTTIRTPKGRQRTSAAAAFVVVVALVALLGMTVVLVRKLAALAVDAYWTFVELTVQVGPWVGGVSLAVLAAVVVDWRKVQLPRTELQQVEQSTPEPLAIEPASPVDLIRQWTQSEREPEQER